MSFGGIIFALFFMFHVALHLLSVHLKEQAPFPPGFGGKKLLLSNRIASRNHGHMGLQPHPADADGSTVGSVIDRLATRDFFTSFSRGQI